MTHLLAPLTLTVSSLDEMNDFARRLAQSLKPGDVVALNGTLGAGKTTFIQLLSKALGVTEKVVSPTFVLVHEYLSGKYPLIHADLYRLGPERSESLVDEIFAFAQQGIALVEWAEYGPFLEGLTTVAIHIEADPATEARNIRISSNRKDMYEQLG